MKLFEFTVKEFAQVERVNEKTVRRWIAKGAVNVRRTPGGGLRIIDRRNEVDSRVSFFMTSRDIDGHPVT